MNNVIAREKIMKWAQKTNTKQVWAKMLSIISSAEQYGITLITPKRITELNYNRQALSPETSNRDYIRYYLGTTRQTAKLCQTDKKHKFTTLQFCF